MIFSRKRISGTAIVTGAASGLGRAIALELARDGWRLALIDLPAEGLDSGDSPAMDELLKIARASGGGGLVATFDVRDADSWQRLHDRLRSEWGSLDLLVNSAGVGATGEVGSLPAGQWRRVIETNLIGTALGCETFLPWLRAHPHTSHLINVASIAGILALPSMAAYSASKAGVIALSESIAAECGYRRPGVTIVCPGFFRSGLLTTWHFSSPIESKEARRRMRSAWWSSERVARRALRAARLNRRYLVVGVTARWLWRLKRLAPRVTTCIIHMVYKRLTRD